jgi:excisionase family DNA binding protein
VADRLPIPDLLTPEEAAERMRCAPITVRRLIASGELGHVVHARRRWTTPDYIARYLEGRSVDPWLDDGQPPRMAERCACSGDGSPPTGTSSGATTAASATADRLARPIFGKRR